MNPSGRKLKAALGPVADFLLSVATLLATPFLRLLTRNPALFRRTRERLDAAGVTVLRHHYYSPAVVPIEIRKPLDGIRDLPGVDLNLERQLELIGEFSYRDELLAIPMEPASETAFGYNNDAYESGDAELLYNVIRKFKPRRIVEIGCGQSTKLMQLAISRNVEEDGSYECRQTCIEPFEQPWLEKLDIELIRKKVEDCPLELFTELGPNDILFIDSSHVIRPQGDVLTECLDILPRIGSGVLVHVHDIFTPRDYPAAWVLRDRRLWNEQYLLEAFLSFNRDFEVLLAANMLANDHADKLATACPVLSRTPGKQPGAFWLRRL